MSPSVGQAGSRRLPEEEDYSNCYDFFFFFYNLVLPCFIAYGYYVAHHRICKFAFQQYIQWKHHESISAPASIDKFACMHINYDFFFLLLELYTHLYSHTYFIIYDRWQCIGVPVGRRTTSSGIRTPKTTSTPRKTEKPISFGFDIEHKLSPCWILGPELEPCWVKCGDDLVPNRQTKFQVNSPTKTWTFQSTICYIVRQVWRCSLV